MALSTPSLLSNLISTRPTGGSTWRARCPAHEDTVPSLNVRLVDGKYLLRCHAGCDTRDILKALELDWSALFTEGGPRTTNEPIASYEYRDETGRLLYVVDRFEPKSFRQRRPTAQGGWEYNLEGIRRVLYRLPELLKGIHDNRWVFIVEGEKDVETLRSQNYVATTSSGGVNGWRDEFATSLTAARVCIIPDNDVPGQQYAERVRASIKRTCQRCQLINLPNLLPHEDVTNWIGRGGTGKQLEQLVLSVRSESPAKTLDNVVSKPVDWLWDKRIPRRKLTIIGGIQGAGKSYLALSLLADNAGSGEHGLLVTFEDDPMDTVRPRAEQLGADLSKVHVWNALANQFLVPENVVDLQKYIERNEITTVIVDPLPACFGESDTWREEAIRSKLRALMLPGITVIGIMHLAKSTDYDTPVHRFLGGNAFTAFARSVLLVENNSVRVIKANVACRRDAAHFVIDNQGFRFT
jgi:hypothetical protein